MAGWVCRCTSPVGTAGHGLRELGWFMLDKRRLQGHTEPHPVPKGAPRELERDWGQGQGKIEERGMALS